MKYNTNDELFWNGFFHFLLQINGQMYIYREKHRKLKVLCDGRLICIRACGTQLGKWGRKSPFFSSLGASCHLSAALTLCINIAGQGAEHRRRVQNEPDRYAEVVVYAQ